MFNLLNYSDGNLEPFCEYFKDFVDDENKYTEEEYQELIKKLCKYPEFIKDHKWKYSYTCNTYHPNKY